MRQFLLYHRHAATDCAAAFAAWNGFRSHLRGTEAPSTCAYGGHQIWWVVDAPDAAGALGQLPPFVARRTRLVRVAPVTVP